MIPLFKVRMSPEAKNLVSETLDSGFIGQGPKVEEFENNLWKQLGTNTKPLTVNSCTSALDLALELCEVGVNDYVISTPVTCFATNSPIINRGARILWADVDPNTFCIDPKSVEELLKDFPETKAIMAVDWAGRACDYKSLKQFNVPVIQDAAHSWIFYPEGDYACYSFQAIKFLTCGDGGALIVPEDKYKLAKLLRWYGLDREAGQSFRCTQNIQHAGFKYHMNDISASIGISNIGLAGLSVLQHRRNAHRYDKAFQNLSTITTPPWGGAYWLYSLKVEKGTKEEFIKYLEENGIASSPVHFRNDLYDCTKEFKWKTLPGVEEFAKKQVSIPVGWWLTEEDVQHIIKVVQSY